MPKPITGTVRFNVSATPYKSTDGRWMVQTVETGIVTYGYSEEEAMERNARANMRLVSRWKTHGRAVLARFMRKHGIFPYTIDDEPAAETPEVVYEATRKELKLAA